MLTLLSNWLRRRPTSTGRASRTIDGPRNWPRRFRNCFPSSANSSARQQNYRRAEELAEEGKQFRNLLDWELCWYFETRHFLKGGSRVIAMADYKAEKALVLAVPHRFFIGEPEQIAAPTTPTPAPRQRRPRGCPFRSEEHTSELQ